MKPKKLIPLSPSEVENRAIAFVMAWERAAGRTPKDTRHAPGSLVDIESIEESTGEMRLIELKAFGGEGRGEDLWLEPNQVSALSTIPGSHLYVVTNVRSEDPADVRILDLGGEQLGELLTRKRERRYFEVPLPVAVYDDMRDNAVDHPVLSGSGFVLRVLEAVAVLHRRGFHQVRFETMMAPTGLQVRLFVGRRSELPGGHPASSALDDIAHVSLDDAEESSWNFAGTDVPAWWSAEMIADQILTAIPPLEAVADDAGYVAELRALLERHKADATLPLTESHE